MSALSFWKVHGAGNDFVLLDAREQTLPDDLADLAVRLCDRRLGVGADGILVVGPPHSPQADASMHIQNSDGSYAEMCGNGLRCVARHLLSAAPERDEVVVDTGAGPLRCRAARDAAGVPRQVRVDMGRPIVAPDAVPVESQAGDPDRETPEAPLVGAPITHPDGTRFTFTAVSMGNPHAILFVAEDEPAHLARRFGPALEVHPRFPRKANISFVRQEGPDAFRAAVWERGAGLTAACGTGAAAIGVAAVLEGRAASGSPIAVALPGGTLTIEVAAGYERVHMTGPADVVYRGSVEIEDLASADACRRLTALLAPPASEGEPG